LACSGTSCRAAHVPNTASAWWREAPPAHRRRSGLRTAGVVVSTAALCRLCRPGLVPVKGAFVDIFCVTVACVAGRGGDRAEAAGVAAVRRRPRCTPTDPRKGTSGLPITITTDALRVARPRVRQSAVGAAKLARSRCSFIVLLGALTPGQAKNRPVPFRKGGC
jgi:hypothetical protein